MSVSGIFNILAVDDQIV